MRKLAPLFLLLCSMPAFAAMRADPVEWTVGGTDFSGFVVYDDAVKSLRPGLVMVPNWLGAGDAAVAKAKEIAGEKYVILVADVYGKGVRPRDHTEAMAEVRKAYAAPEGVAARVGKAVEVLKAQAGKAPLSADRLGAFGFCFGGGAVLELARSGADVAGVVSIHGDLKGAAKAEPDGIKASVLVLNGADDPSVPDADIVGFEKEMDAARVDWQFVDFGGATHGFTEPGAPGEACGICAYNERSAKRAYRMMDDFFAERFAAR